MKTPMSRRGARLLGVALQILALSLGGALASAALAQKYPSKPIRLVIPATPGGGLSIVGRLAGLQITQRLGQNVVVDNIAGASQQLGTQTVVRAAPDGYTLLFTSSTPVTIAENFEPKPPYDARRDLVGVSVIARNPGLFVINAGVKANNVREFIALAKAQPGKFFYGSPGTGHVFHLVTELFAKEAGIKMTHVPYKGSAPAVVALLAGDLQFLLQSTETVKGHIRAGKLRALATLDPQRLESFPDIPTLAENGLKNLTVAIWYGVLAPAKTPADVIATLEGALLAAVKSPEFASKLREMDFEPIGEGSKDFARRLSEEFDLWPGLIKSIGIAKSKE